MPDEKIWKPLELAKTSADYLAGKGVPSARLDAEILLAHVLGLKGRVNLYAGFEQTVSNDALNRYRECVRRRANREPVSRILGVREFMGIPFRVTPAVFSPRPETEILVEAALRFIAPPKAKRSDAIEARRAEAGASHDPDAGALDALLDSYAENVEREEDVDKPAAPAPVRAKATASRVKTSAFTSAVASGGPERRVVDLGTGSGAIAVAMAAHAPGVRVVAVDVSGEALAVARENAERARVTQRIDFREGDFFAALRADEAFDAILSNPPYIVPGDPDLWPEAERFDPPLSLYGGKDGLDCVRRLAAEAARWLVPGGRIFVEVGAGQGQAARDLLAAGGFVPGESFRDGGGVERVVTAKNGLQE